MNYNRKNLEDLYSQVAGKPVAQRKHLDVWTEQDKVENSPKEKKEISLTIDNIKKLLDDIDIDHGDSEQLQALYNRISTFEGYRPIKDTLKSKGFNELILKRFSSDVQSLIESLPDKDKKAFFGVLKDNLTDKSNGHQFPKKTHGNIYSDLSQLGISNDLIKQIFSHTGQDAAKRGVGMGEVALALLFTNIDSAGATKSRDLQQVQDEMGEWNKWEVGPEERRAKRARYAELKPKREEIKKRKVKGDLELDGQEFEIKGEGASLGETPDVVYNKKGVAQATVTALSNMGISSDGSKLIVGNRSYDHLADAIAAAYNSTENKQLVEDGFKELMINGARLEDHISGITSSSIYNSINLSEPKSIQRGVAVLNLLRYTQHEGFTYFMAHDIGASKGQIAGSGEYVFAGGSPEQIAASIRDNHKVKFERIKINNLRPRIGFGNKFIIEDEEHEAL